MRIEGLWFLDALAEIRNEHVPLPLITLLNPAPVVAHDHLGGFVPHLLRDEQGVFTARK